MGPYAQMVLNFNKNCYGNLKYLDDMMIDYDVWFGAKYLVVDFSPSFQIHSIRSSTEKNITDHIKGKCRSLYIVEDLSEDIIEELGSKFGIEPQFFAEHLRAVEWEHHNDRSNAAMLPSVRHFARYWSLQYFEPIAMHKNYASERTRIAMNVLRRIDFRSPRTDLYRKGRIGLVKRVVSFWHRYHSDGDFFDGVSQ
jgi:hypothetical protein